MTAYQYHRSLILALKRGERVDLKELNRARRRADRVGAIMIAKAAQVAKQS